MELWALALQLLCELAPGWEARWHQAVAELAVAVLLVAGGLVVQGLLAYRESLSEGRCLGAKHYTLALFALTCRIANA